MKMIVLGERENQIIKMIQKSNKKDSRDRMNGVFYSDNEIYFTNNFTALKVYSDYFSFSDQPESNKLYNIISTTKDKNGVYTYYLELADYEAPNFSNMWLDKSNKKESFGLGMHKDNDFPIMSCICKIYGIQEGYSIRPCFIEPLQINRKEDVLVYCFGESKPVLFEIDYGEYIVCPVKLEKG